MLSTLAIVVAGISLIIVSVTVYRNLPSEPTIVLKSDHGDIEVVPQVNSLTGANGPPPPSQYLEQVIVVDNELNLIL